MNLKIDINNTMKKEKYKLIYMDINYKKSFGLDWNRVIIKYCNVMSKFSTVCTSGPIEVEKPFKSQTLIDLFLN